MLLRITKTVHFQPNHHCGMIYRPTIKMASLMCASLSLFVNVAPVSGQVKYTPDTERQVESFTGTLDP